MCDYFFVRLGINENNEESMYKLRLESKITFRHVKKQIELMFDNRFQVNKIIDVESNIFADSLIVGQYLQESDIIRVITQNEVETSLQPANIGDW